MEAANQDVLRDRVGVLEQTVVFQNRVGLVGLIAILALFSIGWLVSRPSKDLVVHSLELRDETGVVRGRLGLNSDGTPQLAMFDHKGIRLVTMGQTFQGSSALSFYDEGETRMQLSSISKGTSSLRFMDDANETLSSIYIRPDRGMGISLASGTEGLFLGLGPDRKPGFRVVDLDAEKAGRMKLAPEELERFALPVKGKSKTADEPTSREVKSSKSTQIATPPQAGTAVSIVTFPTTEPLAMHAQDK